MVKVISAFKRNPVMTVEAFTEYWRTTHAGIVAKIPGIKSYYQAQTIESAYRDGEPPYDGLAEISYEDTAAMHRAASTAEARAGLADDDNFLDMSTFVTLLTSEVMQKEGPREPSMLKLATFVFRKPGLSVEDFQKYWRERHAPIVLKLPEVCRYVQSHTRPSSYSNNRVPAFDGIAEVWFDSIEAMRQSAKRPEYAAVRSDEGNFLDVPRLNFIITRERRIV
ncbi:MAG: EthD family reductase [Candidatus Binataceae bacterium]